MTQARSPLSFQLYSARANPDIAAVLNALAAAGYGAVEGYGGLKIAPSELRDLLDAAGLAMPSNHLPLTAVEADPGAAIAAARTLGVQKIVVPFLSENERPTDAEGWRAFGARLEQAASPFLAAGFEFGWHNHAFELEPLADGGAPLTHLFSAAPSIGWEADLAWIARGGADPLEWIEKLSSRLIAVHVKDIAPEGENLEEDGWADIGAGTLDWPAFLKASEPTNPLLIVEHDRPIDALSFARRAIETLRGMGAA